MFATLIILAAIAQDPFQEQATQQLQAESQAKQDAAAARHKAAIDNSAAPDADVAAKLVSRTWKGSWCKDGTTTTASVLNGKLVRVYRQRGHGNKWFPTSVEIQDDKGTLWQSGFTFGMPNDKASEAYVRAFLADWEKKHAARK
jgi:hypothetical protein